MTAEWAPPAFQDILGCIQGNRVILLPNEDTFESELHQNDSIKQDRCLLKPWVL